MKKLKKIQKNNYDGEEDYEEEEDEDIL